MPQGVVNFDHRGTVGRIYKGHYQILLHTKYRSSGPSGFREKKRNVITIVSLWELSVAMETTILIQSASRPDAVKTLTQ